MDRTSEICPSFNLDTPPSENGELESRDTIFPDSISVDRDNKGLISNEIISNDKTNLAYDNDVSKSKHLHLYQKDSHTHQLRQINWNETSSV